MEKKEKVRRLRPQSGKRLRELREQHQLRQMDFAEQVNEHMRVKLPMFRSSEALTQSMVSDLELGNADLSILHLFAISSFFGVAPLDLLGDGLQAVGKSEIKLCGTAELRNCGTAELRNCGTAELRNCGTAELLRNTRTPRCVNPLIRGTFLCALRFRAGFSHLIRVLSAVHNWPYRMRSILSFTR
ncbi:helix-turn-helix domain-containing protein [Candidatus Thiothrix anitrata]|uniref:Helix-turn-helix transcriptional regulator n=1 Tax=Candidatus Thiothrix anitrata TaxID=2823902 RepID=A0ABX7X716_9GAMM|nr:helix-turn-helix transcriptional regulator [Candidatus Thiothrix anitrata]QTR50523.1 helix-turn-helix transcriptional regulator [Candidatus Thiothrix anitrata]